MGRIERHVGSSRLEDREEPDHHLGRPFHAQPHARLGPYAQRAQVMREAVGLGVQLGVREPPILVLHRRRVRGLFGLRLEQLMDAPIRGEDHRGGGRGGRRVGPGVELCDLGLGQERQLRQAPVWVRQGVVHERPQVAAEPLGRRPRDPRRVIGDRHGGAIRAVRHGHGQAVLGGGHHLREEGPVRPEQRLSHLRGAHLEEAHVIERRLSRAPRHPCPLILHHHVERHRLVADRVDGRPPRA